MSEAPGPSDGGVDFGGPTEETERFGMPAAFPPPQEKTDGSSVKGEHQPGVGVPNNSEGSDQTEPVDTPDATKDQITQEDEGTDISVPPGFEDYRRNDTDIPERSAEAQAEDEKFEAEIIHARSTRKGLDKPEVETTARSNQQDKGENQTPTPPSSQETTADLSSINSHELIERAHNARADARDLRSVYGPEDKRIAGLEIEADKIQTELKLREEALPQPNTESADTSPTIENQSPEQGQTSVVPHQETDLAKSQEVAKIVANKLFQDLRSGEKILRDTSNNTAWRSEEKIAAYEEGESYRIIFKQVGGNETRNLSLPKIQQIADEIAGYNRPEPLRPPTKLERQAHRIEVSDENMLKELEERRTVNREKTEPDSEGSTTPPTITHERAAPLPPETPKTTSEGSLERGETTEEEINKLFGALKPHSMTLKQAGNEWHINRIVPNNLRADDAIEATRIIEALGLNAAIDKYPNLIPGFELENQNGIKSFYNETNVKLMLKSTLIEERKGLEKQESKNDEPRVSEMTSLQIGKIDKLLKAVDAKDTAEIKKLFNTVGTEAALKKARKQLGIKRRVRDSEGNLNEKFIEELRKAQEEERIREKAPEPKTQESKPETSTPKEAPTRLTEQIKKGREQARIIRERVGEKIEDKRVRVVTSLREKARESKLGRILFAQGEAFLNKIDLRDKHIVVWLSGVTFGAANTLLTPLGPLTNIYRVPMMVGLNLAGTKGINMLRLNAIERALKPYVSNETALSEWVKRYNGAFKLIRGDDKSAFNEEVTKFNEALIQQGVSPDIIGYARNISQEALSQKIESLRKYDTAQQWIRSFSAGVSVGSIGTGAVLMADWLTDFIAGGGSETVDILPSDEPGAPPGEGPPSGVTFETLNPQAIPPEIANTPNAAENWETFANHWNTLDTGQREEFLNIMSDPDQVSSLETWAEAHSAVAPEFEPVQAILGSPENFTTLDITQGDTVGALAIENGYDNFWEANPDNAALKGLTIEENRALLEQATKSAANAGLATEAIPSEAELVELMNRAATGDLAANARLNEALHWIPEGGKLKLLNESVLSEAVINLKLAP